MRTLLLCGFAFTAITASAAEPTAAEIFEQRIMPIFKSPNPSSCVQCHLTGVDLKDYILPDAERTFRSLRDQKLINLEKPEKSKIIKLIEMGKADAKAANAVSAKLRKLERDAFLAWITACAADPKLAGAEKLDPKELAKPERPVEVIWHNRKDNVLESFEKNVWAWRFRCMNCHTEGTPQNDKLKKEHGDRVAWVKKAGAAETMDYLMATKLIDTENPEKSLLLTKPLGDVKHGGGIKFVVGDDAYKGFRIWLEDLAAIRKNKYTSAKDLPPPDIHPLRFGSDIWLKLTDCPPEWGGKLLQTRIYGWDANRKGWEDMPIAVSDRNVNGKDRYWQHNITLLSMKNLDRAKEFRANPVLPEGKYLVKIYVDTEGKLAKDWKAELVEKDLAGQVEIQSAWKAGYGSMTTVKIPAKK
jgi:hypothetical protein